MNHPTKPWHNKIILNFLLICMFIFMLWFWYVLLWLPNLVKLSLNLKKEEKNIMTFLFWHFLILCAFLFSMTFLLLFSICNLKGIFYIFIIYEENTSLLYINIFTKRHYIKVRRLDDFIWLLLRVETHKIIYGDCRKRSSGERLCAMSKVSATCHSFGRSW